MMELDSQLPAVLRGEVKPRDASENIDIAWLCLWYKHQNAAAARFYAEAFAAQPELAADLTKQHRYNAACAAALVGCAQGEDAGTLDEAEQARLRSRALDWLTADLAHWAKQIDSAEPQAMAVTLKTLTHWQRDPDLAGVRDAEGLANLAEAEQESWRTLWAELQRTIASARDAHREFENH